MYHVYYEHHNFPRKQYHTLLVVLLLQNKQIRNTNNVRTQSNSRLRFSTTTMAQDYTARTHLLKNTCTQFAPGTEKSKQKARNGERVRPTFDTEQIELQKGDWRCTRDLSTSASQHDASKHNTIPVHRALVAGGTVCYMAPLLKNNQINKKSKTQSTK